MLLTPSRVPTRLVVNRVWRRRPTLFIPTSMALRRTALPRGTRSTAAGASHPPSAASSRPRTTLSRPSSALKSDRSTPAVEDRLQPPPTVRSSRSATLNPTTEESESNIQVAIRCRRRSEREIEENSPIIVQTNGAKSEDITIETAAPSSVLGVVTLPPTRTYPFDRVFGPEADQALIYHDVVHPMLEEVLQGYNCTLFAYGQTGTGKT